jgi:hypothetical protein
MAFLLGSCFNFLSLRLGFMMYQAINLKSSFEQGKSFFSNIYRINITKDPYFNEVLYNKKIKSTFPVYTNRFMLLVILSRVD